MLMQMLGLVSHAVDGVDGGVINVSLSGSVFLFRRC